MFVFDNTANGCLDSPLLNPKQTGELHLVIDFGANPGTNLTILLYGEFENLLEINRNWSSQTTSISKMEKVPLNNVGLLGWNEPKTIPRVLRNGPL